jgi:response regulator RpfG family c-di-GMP phosphodiesterase
MNSCDKILLVDDDVDALSRYQDLLQQQFALDTAPDGDKALALMRRNGPYTVIVADMNMPEMSGIELLKQARHICPDTVRIMLTGDPSQETAMLAINDCHVLQFLTKPCRLETLVAVLQRGITQYHFVLAERELLEQTLSGSVKMLTDILSIVEPQSFGQGQKLREDIRLLAEFLKINPTWDLEMAGLLYRIGYATIPPAIIERARIGSSLTNVEKGLLIRTPEFGRSLLENIPRLESVAQFIYYQNKNFDGTGFPNDGLDGEKIPLGGRILKILGDMVELESKGIQKIQALTQMKRCPGCYDPKLLEAALACLLLEKKGLALKLNDLCVGQVLLSAIETMEGMLIIPAGNRVSTMLMTKLTNFTELSGIKEPIFVEG